MLPARASQNPVIWVSENSVVNLTLDGDNLLDTRRANYQEWSAIKIYSDSTLNITGNGTLTTISSYWPSIVTHGACRINISGENTAVKAYGMRFDAATPFAIQEDDSNSGDANLQLSVTGGATLEAYGGIRATKLKLDDTATLWSQAYRNGVPPALPPKVEYESSDTYLYYFSNDFLPRSVVIGAVHIVICVIRTRLNQTATGSFWIPARSSLMGRSCARVSNRFRVSGSMGSWALLKGKKAVTPTPPVAPERIRREICCRISSAPACSSCRRISRSTMWTPTTGSMRPVKSAWANEADRRRDRAITC